MNDGDLFSQTIRAMIALAGWASKNPREAGAISLFSVSTDIWAIAALQAMRKGDAIVADAADEAYDRSLSIMIRVVVLIGALAVFAAGEVTLADRFPDRFPIVAAAIALPVAIIGWTFLPRFAKWAEDRAMQIVHRSVEEGWRRDILSNLVRFNPTKPGFFINLFYFKVLFLDSVICSAVVLKMVNASLMWFRVPF